MSDIIAMKKQVLKQQCFDNVSFGRSEDMDLSKAVVTEFIRPHFTLKENSFFIIIYLS